jgi:hypothetical protein
MFKINLELCHRLRPLLHLQSKTAAESQHNDGQWYKHATFMSITGSAIVLGVFSICRGLPQQESTI